VCTREGGEEAIPKSSAACALRAYIEWQLGLESLAAANARMIGPLIGTSALPCGTGT
jgi:hypothetical protein